MTAPPFASARRQWLRAGAACAATLAAPLASLAAPVKIRVGYWPVAAGLPFFTAIEKGFFRDAGLDVEPLKFAGAQQVMEAMLAGRADGSANGTGTANLAIGAIAKPDLFRIFCTNPSSAIDVLEEFLVPIASPVRSVADLKGKRIASGPGIQNVTLARTLLERAGAGSMKVTELPIGQHVAALAVGQIDAAYTLEPTGTVGRLNGTTRVLEAGVVAHYILGDPKAPWHGGAASLTTPFLEREPDAATRYIDAYARGVAFVRDQPAEARAFLKGYTAIDGELTKEVPLAAYRLHDEFTAADVGYFQQFYDLFTEKGIFERRVAVDGLLYKSKGAA